MLLNPKIVQTTREIKMSRKLHAAKISCLQRFARNFKYVSYWKEYKDLISKKQALEKK